MRVYALDANLTNSSSRSFFFLLAAVGSDDPSAWPKPKMLFEGPYLFSTGPTQFDVARDGRLLMVKPVDADGEGAPSQLVVVQNWFEELRRLAPRK